MKASRMSSGAEDGGVRGGGVGVINFLGALAPGAPEPLPFIFYQVRGSAPSQLVVLL